MEDWKECKFSDLYEIPSRNGLSKPSRIRGSGYKMINMGELFSNDRIYNIPMELVPLSDSEKETAKIERDDLLFARQSLVAEGAGKCSIVLETDELTVFESHLIRVRLNKNIASPLFYYYYFKSRNSPIKAIIQHCVQAGIKGSDLAEITVKLPPLPTQQKIAQILSSLDDKIELNNKINANLEQQAQSLFKSWFVDFEPFGGEMPAGWKEKPLYEYAEFINGTSFKEDEYGTVGVPIIKIAELKNGITDATQYFNGTKDSKYDVKDGDILFSWSGNPETSIDIFIWTLGNAILNQHTFNVKSNTNRKWFTYCLLKYFKPEFCHRAGCKQTTGLGHVTANDLKQIMFSSDEKSEIDFENLITPIMEQIYNNKVENQKLASIRDTLLPKLMNGEISL